MSMDPLFLVVDLFCGAGGTTTGFEMSGGLAKVIACVNHDPKAIKSHWLNHPDVKHFEEDIRTLELAPLKAVVDYWKAQYPNAKLILWASLECTNFSKAKGGQPRDADSRTLADHLQRYIHALNPDLIQIENVVEFMAWGPLDENGKPVSKRNGVEWMRWRKEICELGYQDEWKELNSADFGAYTSRNRLFGAFTRDGLGACFPEPTHHKNPSKGNLFASLEKWKAVKEVLDFSDEGNSIFERKKPLSEKTLARIYAGLLKYVAGGDTSFIQKYFSGRSKGKVKDINSPAGVVTTFGNQTLVNCNFLLKYYSNGGELSSIEEPCGTLPTKDRHALMKAFIMNTNFNNVGSSLEKPSPVITASRHHHYLMNPQWFGNNGDLKNPCPTIIARQDKAPLYLITATEGRYNIPVFEDDCEEMVKIKEFMAAYGIIDIKMRMLKVSELLRIQGFPKNYKLEGTQADQKKFIGNSVHPAVVKAWVESMANRIRESCKAA